MVNNFIMDKLKKEKGIEILTENDFTNIVEKIKKEKKLAQG